MDDSIVIREFERLAQQFGIEIRYTIEGPSGLCTVKGKQVLFVDRSLDKESRINLFKHEFETLDLEGVFVVPLIRRLLGKEDGEGEG